MLTVRTARYRPLSCIVYETESKPFMECGHDKLWVVERLQRRKPNIRRLKPTAPNTFRLSTSDRLRAGEGMSGQIETEMIVYRSSRSSGSGAADRLEDDQLDSPVRLTLYGTPGRSSSPRRLLFLATLGSFENDVGPA